MTVTTPLRKSASLVTRVIKQHFNVPIIWGGYDPTVNAEKCLENSDYVCIGEGDQTIIELAERIDQGKSIKDVCNLAYIQDEQVKFNPKAPLEQHIDNYPWRDNTPENKYFIEDNQLLENYSVINDGDPGYYETMSARGCPYRCSYCCEATLKDIYSGEKFLRRRSPEDLIEELIQAKNQIKLKEIHFEDEIFGINLKWLLVFLPLYRKYINLPFHAYIYPCHNIEEILKELKAAGLTRCCLSLQTGSERINKEIFNRVYDRELYLKAVRTCKKLDIPFYSDIITFNPFEEEIDLKNTLDVLLEIGGNFALSVNKLFVLPGTKLADKIQNDGFSIPYTSRDKLFNYYSRLFWITSSSNYSRLIIKMIEKISFLKNHPSLINPLIIKAILIPSLVYSKIKRTIYSN